MLNNLKLKLTKESLRDVCKQNSFFALGLLSGLLDTPLCIIEPSRVNKFSHAAFQFTANTDEYFLECVLDCIELLTGEPAFFITVDTPEGDGYMLAIKNQALIEKLVLIKTDTPAELSPWVLIGLLVIKYNCY